MRQFIAVLGLVLSACGGGSDPEFPGDAAAVAEMHQACASHGSSIEKFVFHTSVTHSGAFLGRGWECWCAPNSKGEGLYLIHPAPVE